MRILIVEDEPSTAAYLKRGLSENGFVADVVEDGICPRKPLVWRFGTA